MHWEQAMEEHIISVKNSPRAKVKHRSHCTAATAIYYCLSTPFSSLPLPLSLLDLIISHSVLYLISYPLNTPHTHILLYYIPTLHSSRSIFDLFLLSLPYCITISITSRLTLLSHKFNVNIRSSVTLMYTPTLVSESASV